MKLAAWLTKEGLSYADFGSRIDRTGEAVRRYASGERIPDRDTMPLIARESRGEVMANDFYDLEQHAADDNGGGERSSPGSDDDLSAAGTTQAAA